MEAPPPELPPGSGGFAMRKSTTSDPGPVGVNRTSGCISVRNLSFSLPVPARSSVQ